MTRPNPLDRLGRSVVVLALTGAMVLGGCTSGRSDLGTGSSGCFLTVPRAVTAVHGAGHLKGLRLESVASLKPSDTELYRAARSAGAPRVGRVCLVAFSGRFSAQLVERPVGRSAGRLAVVELTYPGDRLLATLIVAHLPFVFGHSHVGFF